MVETQPSFLFCILYRDCTLTSTFLQMPTNANAQVLARNSVAHTQLLEAGPEALAVLTGAAGAAGRSSRARGSAGKALSRLAACNAELARRIGPPWAGEAACTADEGEQGEAAAMMGQLTAIITGGEPSRRAQAAQAVADVAGEDPTASRELAASGIVGPLVELLGAGTSEGKHYAAAALAKMAADRLVLDTIYSAGAVTPLVSVCAVATHHIPIYAAHKHAHLHPFCPSLAAKSPCVLRVSRCHASAHPHHPVPCAGGVPVSSGCV